MTSKRPQAPANLPLFLVTLPRSDKSQKIFQLTFLSHCYNCQQFGHVWANCKQPPKCVWCGGGHLHKECPEKENRDSTPTCCNCKLTEGEKPHPSSYRGCKRGRAQKIQTKEPTGRVFSTRLTTPTVSFAEAVNGKRNNPPQQDRQHQPQLTTGGWEEKSEKHNKERDLTGQTASKNHTSSMDSTFKVVTVVQQIMTGLNESVSEEGKIMAITKIVMKLPNNEHQSPQAT